MATPEVKVKNKIKAILKKYNCYYALPVMQGMAQNGTPDILASVGGVFFGIEAKAGQGKPTELQKVQLRKIRESGGVSVVVYEGNLEAFETLVKTLLQNKSSQFIVDWVTAVYDGSLYADWRIEEYK